MNTGKKNETGKCNIGIQIEVKRTMISYMIRSSNLKNKHLYLKWLFQ